MPKTSTVFKTAIYILLVSMITGSFPHPAFCRDDEHFSPYIQRFSNGYIDWDNGFIYGIGKAYPDMNKGSRALAARAAKVLAMQSILKIAAGINLDDQTVLRQLGNGRITIHLQALIRAQQHAMELKRVQNRPYIQITLKTPLSGVEGLTARLLGHLKENPGIWQDFPRKMPSAPPKESSEPWLVIDARGVAHDRAVKPALFPKIKSETGETLYQLKSVDEKALQNRGMAHYVVTGESKKQLEGEVGISRKLFLAIQRIIEADSAFAGEKKKRRRFIVKDAIKTDGISKVNLIISKEDASQLKREDASSMILKKCRVIVIVNSPVGGVKGSCDPVLFLSRVN